MPLNKEFANVLRKISVKIEEDPTRLTDLYWEYGGRRDEESAYTVENFVNVACNHLFDDNPSVYGITHLEGHILRYHFSQGIEDYEFVPDLLKEFPELFKKIGFQEDYLDFVNERRTKHGLEPIVLD